MAAAQICSATQSDKTSPQNSNLPENRKRKSSMPSYSNPQYGLSINLDRSNPAIEAVIFSYNYPKETVLKCAQDLVNGGKKLNITNLLSECEKSSHEIPCASYSEPMDFVTSVSPSSALSCPSSTFSTPSSSHSSGYSSYTHSSNSSLPYVPVSQYSSLQQASNSPSSYSSSQSSHIGMVNHMDVSAPYSSNHTNFTSNTSGNTSHPFYNGISRSAQGSTSHTDVSVPSTSQHMHFSGHTSGYTSLPSYNGISRSALGSMVNDIEEDCPDGMITNLPSVRDTVSNNLGGLTFSGLSSGSSSMVNSYHNEFNAVSSFSSVCDAGSLRSSSGSYITGCSDMPIASSLSTSRPSTSLPGPSASDSKPLSGLSEVKPKMYNHSDIKSACGFQALRPQIHDHLTTVAPLPVSRSTTDVKDVWNEADNSKLLESEASGDLECKGIQQKDHQQILENKFNIEIRSPEHKRVCLKLVRGENSILEKSRNCTVCTKNPRDVTFLPCGHFTTCRSCAEPIFVCPLCSKTILATVNTFLS